MIKKSITFYNKIIKSKAYILRAKYSFVYKIGIGSLLKDKIKIFIKLFLSIFYIRKTSTKIDYLFYDPLTISNNKRMEYIQYFYGLNTVSANYKSYLYFNQYQQIIMFIKNFIALVIYSNIIFRFDKNSHSRNIQYFILIAYIDAIKPKKIFFFNFIDTVSYITSGYLSKYFTNVDVYYIYTQGTLYELCRYDKFENINIVIASKLQRLEIAYYIKQKLMILKNSNIIQWGDDNIKTIETYNKKQIYDIGIYSSGDWTRTKDFIRASNINKIKEYQYIDNPNYICLTNVLSILKDKKYNTKTIKIYLHPFEKELIKKYKIYPPYWKELITKDNFIIDRNEEISNLFETKIAITVASSLAYSRINYNLDTLFFIPQKNKISLIPFPPKKVFESYDKYIYSSIEEFQKKLDGLLNG